MFLCRTGRLSALDQALRSPVSLLAQVSAHRLRSGAVQRLRTLCASGGGVDPQTPVHLGTRQPVHSWDPRCGFRTTTTTTTADWAHLERVTTIALKLSERVLRGGAECDVIRRPLVHTTRRHTRGAQPAARALFTLSGRRSPSTMTVQTRASSTSAATTKRQPEEGEPAGGSRGDVETLKDASTTSSTEKGPGDTEPEGGKPSKTQLLKKVFKEYGAVGVSFHIGISLMSLGMFYLLISSGTVASIHGCVAPRGKLMTNEETDNRNGNQRSQTNFQRD